MWPIPNSVSQNELKTPGSKHFSVLFAAMVNLIVIKPDIAYLLLALESVLINVTSKALQERNC